MSTVLFFYALLKLKGPKQLLLHQIATYVWLFDVKRHFSEFQSNLSSFWVTTNDDENGSTELTAKVTMAKAGISQVNRDLSRRSVHW